MEHLIREPAVYWELEGNSVDMAIESLLNAEKQCCLAGDVASTRKDIVELSFKDGAWKTLNCQIVVLSKRRRASSSSLRAPAENGVTGEDGSGVPVFAEYNLDELRASTDGFATDHIVFDHCEKEPNTIYHGPSSALAPPSPSSSSTAPPGLTHANSWRRLGQLGCCRAFACPTSSDDATRVASGCSLLSS
ncbi:uncharacterized protein [Aegilops tauschii subsp. strangulata]|uniref:uncharacterized protein isoform X1 n=2 Tax=Aegilops tauschii subsp. strangulata TaxID=200361 RepID=UPI003CC8948F